MNLMVKVHELKKLKLEKTELEREIAEIEDFIKAEMIAQDVSEMVVDVFKIRYIPYSTTRVDTTALKAELPEIAARYSKTTESRRLSIT
ncbi:MAG: hypothetical protein LBE35_02805 [Clostridiales bacterium]|jgi:predicted phage-related endonuclease|nr:hypothetical protein [Clostridiales bacterium]